MIFTRLRLRLTVKKRCGSTTSVFLLQWLFAETFLLRFGQGVGQIFTSIRKLLKESAVYIPTFLARKPL
jgi:hypothetical protein